MYGDLETLKELLSITDNSKDNILTLYLKAATAYIDREFGVEHTFNAGNIADETYTIDRFVSGPVSLPKLAVEITAVRDKAANNLTYTPMPQFPPYWGIELASPNLDGITIWYKPGITLTVPDDIALAAMQIAAHWYKLRLADTADAVIIADGMTIQRSGIPLVAAQIIDAYKSQYGKVVQ